MAEAKVWIVGAGLAGLATARRLAQCQIPFGILEASDGVGGRVRTDVVDGFRLDRGFQIYLDAYPEGRRVLDLPALNLKPFTRGVKIRLQGKFQTLVHPREGMLETLRGGLGSIGTFRDKLRLLRLAYELTRGKLDEQLAKPDGLTLDYLRWHGKFTPNMIERFFRPFLRGVFLEPNLTTSSRMFRFVFRMFVRGNATVPALGMQQIPEQIARSLPADSIRFSTRVQGIEPNRIMLQSGERIDAKAVVVATEGPEANRLLGESSLPQVRSCGTITLYFAANHPPESRPILVLNGEGQGIVNNLVVMSAASAEYAPAGQSLVSVSIVGIPDRTDAELDAQVREELRGWYGEGVTGWRLLRIDRIPHALPEQPTDWLEPARRSVRLRPGLYVCGDHRDLASIDGALTSGFRCAQELLEDLHTKRI
ncbi:protoporphyrinogen/coproporphyrinogen oxidase [Tuwongella immobilis]|uniref:Amine oxidase domain-containing protein n=1 Tax=Tuwongella immobilis TaxID=692036 RepID=A0A6C2YPF3_9BACT|nr:NAD(P)/FAD-dependent oxidoreductase [Tuwongella immobilis]VIP03013.1 amine oxidase : Amine oxidase OS=Myxococcus stipitatus (strain DSM 14675 / JCM 12634 / Mx s8) GN=MYSTI_06684 PE=4 SV=1: Amino_oxidase [Tuwongella immobilis]VTS03126.1 amine oxidase : Amine oxidase OS=Myxococcus stipitatus (strain DSM 14675 / JCM 12634 / Mx s8) GN=MYSTI_06684 PE=4 SV=1: Amino_oxidase [Tuwongella immobilis]